MTDIKDSESKILCKLLCCFGGALFTGLMLAEAPLPDWNRFFCLVVGGVVSYNFISDDKSLPDK